MDVQELRVFVIGCPRCGDPVVQKALRKINECADYIGQLQAKNKRLKDDLIEYGRHAAGCSQEFAKKYRCRCGWDKVEQALTLKEK